VCSSDLLFEIPNFPDVPSLDLDQILNQSQQGGGGGGSIFQNEDADEREGLSKDEFADRLEEIIITSVEPEQWAQAGGEGATVRYYDGHLLIKAPDYIHRQLVEYPFAHARRAPATAARRRYQRITP